jgi:hypothetical protein
MFFGHFLPFWKYIIAKSNSQSQWFISTTVQTSASKLRLKWVKLVV